MWQNGHILFGVLNKLGNQVKKSHGSSGKLLDQERTVLPWILLSKSLCLKTTTTTTTMTTTTATTTITNCFSFLLL